MYLGTCKYSMVCINDQFTICTTGIIQIHFYCPLTTSSSLEDHLQVTFFVISTDFSGEKNQGDTSHRCGCWGSPQYRWIDTHDCAMNYTSLYWGRGWWWQHWKAFRDPSTLSLDTVLKTNRISIQHLDCQTNTHDSNVGQGEREKMNSKFYF